MKEIPNLDELLNSFIDDELSPRQHTEVQRLAAHDAKIAQRLKELEQCKMFLSALPVAEAPPQVLENVKASLARRAFVGEEPSTYNEQIGARHLLGRKVFTAAAMIGLVAVLAVVVYSIVAPSVPNAPIATDIPPVIDLTEPASVTAVAAPFSGRLELKTKILPAVVGIINRTIEENIPSDEWIASDRNDVREPHALICSSESFSTLLDCLDDIWNKIDSATLFVDTEVFGQKIIVDAVTTEQITVIVKQDDSTKRIEVAKDFAVLNNVTENLPGREILAAIDNITVDLITPPQPVLTSKTTPKVASRPGAVKNIHLTITVTDSR